jgi:hypothetical protein
VSCGLVALGDSITYGHGGMQSGLGSQSWAQWLAEAMDLPFTRYAVNGATAPDVLRDQVPRLRDRYDVERLHDRYDVATVYVGVNDVRDAGWDAAAYERDLDAILAAVAGTPTGCSPARSRSTSACRPPARRSPRPTRSSSGSPPATARSSPTCATSPAPATCGPTAST